MASKSVLRFTEMRCTRRFFSSSGNICRAEGGSDSMFNSQPRTDQTPNKFSRHSRPQDTGSYQLTRNLLSEQLRKKASSSLEKMRAAAAELEKHTRAQDLDRYQSRRWKEGDVYSPHDLSPIEMAKWRVKQRRQIDAFDVLAINPIDEYKNFAMMWEYCTSMGRIRHRNETGLRGVNQRRIAKAIRRAMGMALLPSVHKHPEMLEAEAKARNLRVKPYRRPN